MIAITQPFLPRFPGFAVLLLLTIVLSVAFWKSALNLQGHAQAGAQVIVAALTPRIGTEEDPDDLTRTMEHVAIMLPGLGEPVPVRIVANSPAADRSLAEINLRGMTGATVLAVTRSAPDGSEVFVPSGRTVLRAGDVVALAGTNEAVTAARAMLAVDRRGEGDGQ